MLRKTAAVEASKLISQYGIGAYDKALEAERKARRSRNVRLATFFASVAKRIRKESGQQDKKSSASAAGGGKDAEGEKGCAQTVGSRSRGASSAS